MHTNSVQLGGFPGSRKHQRWLNDVFLIGGFDNEKLIDRDWNIIEVPRKPSVFHTVSVEDDFLSERLLRNEVKALQKELENNPPRKPQHAPVSFNRIERRLRKMLERFHETEELQKLDDMIYDFVHQAENSKRVIFIDDGLMRIILYGICNYYNVTFSSVEMGPNEAKRVILLKQSSTHVPVHNGQKTPLRHFLSSNVRINE